MAGQPTKPGNWGDRAVIHSEIKDERDRMNGEYTGPPKARKKGLPGFGCKYERNVSNQLIVCSNMYSPNSGKKCTGPCEHYNELHYEDFAHISGYPETSCRYCRSVIGRYICVNERKGLVECAGCSKYSQRARGAAVVRNDRSNVSKQNEPTRKTKPDIIKVRFESKATSTSDSAQLMSGGDAWLLNRALYLHDGAQCCFDNEPLQTCEGIARGEKIDTRYCSKCGSTFLPQQTVQLLMKRDWFNAEITVVDKKRRATSRTKSQKKIEKRATILGNPKYSCEHCKHLNGKYICSNYSAEMVECTKCNGCQIVEKQSESISSYKVTDETKV